jgi:hypothetical protein
VISETLRPGDAAVSSLDSTVRSERIRIPESNGVDVGPGKAQSGQGAESGRRATSFR